MSLPTSGYAPRVMSYYLSVGLPAYAVYVSIRLGEDSPLDESDIPYLEAALHAFADEMENHPNAGEVVIYKQLEGVNDYGNLRNP